MRKSKTKIIKRICKLTVLSLLILTSNSCKKFLQIDPPVNRLISASVFKDDNTATAAVTGIYSDMMQVFRIVSTGLTWYPGLCSDEIYSPSGSAASSVFVTNQIPSDNVEISNYWQQGYRYIYAANAAIEGMENSTTLTLATRNQLLGESYFIRGFMYLYMSSLYGDVPLVLTSDYRLNQMMPRTSKSIVMEQVVADLLKAKDLLSVSYISAERVRPNRFTATALLARAYLYRGDWPNAEKQSSEVISASAYTLSPLSGAFLKSSNETIWQILPVNPSYNAMVANRFIPSNNTSLPTYALTASLMLQFEADDQRRSSWVGTSTVASVPYSYIFKYKIRSGSTPLNEYHIVLRLSEQYLIRAEARAQLNNITGAIGDTNAIRAKAGLAGLPTTISQPQILLAIEKERRTELFGEWGHRWFDLIRTGRAEIVLSALKPTWKSTAMLWPIPVSEINANPSLVQNPGYN